jgi:EAL domain-containing protein (putative c-di-GMP-specific phosphodiesterase class I)
MRSGLINGEFSMVYQPKYSQAKSNIVGAEALIRWNSPTLGNVSPVEFIPVAEETGFIVNIGEWVIATVFQQVAEWKRNKSPLVPIAINISPRHFQRGKIIPTLLEQLRANQLDAALFQIELTEGVVMNDSEATMTNLLELRKHGFKVSIDDFGTGYSSLSYLRRLPIDELKIDRSFIMEISDTLGAKERLAVTAVPLSIIQLARNLDLTVVAEGVETPAQQAFLQENGCDVMQGYLYSRPVPAPAFVHLLKN